MHALDRLLWERFDGKVGRGLALVSSRRKERPDVCNFFLHRSSAYAARVVKFGPERGIMPGQTYVCGKAKEAPSVDVKREEMGETELNRLAEQCPCCVTASHFPRLRNES